MQSSPNSMNTQTRKIKVVKRCNAEAEKREDLYIKRAESLRRRLLACLKDVEEMRQNLECERRAA